MSTGDWTLLVEDLSVQPPSCTQGQDCGTSSFLAEVFCASFLCLCNYIAWNVVVAVVLERFSCIYSLEPDPLLDAMQVNANHVREFMALWDRFDLLFQGWIPNNRILLEAFVSRLGTPLGRDADECGEWVDELQIELRALGPRQEKIYLKDMFTALVTRAIGAEEGEEVDEDVLREAQVQFATKRLLLAKQLAKNQRAVGQLTEDRYAESALVWQSQRMERRAKMAEKILEPISPFSGKPLKVVTESGEEGLEVTEPPMPQIDLVLEKSHAPRAQRLAEETIALPAPYHHDGPALTPVTTTTVPVSSSGKGGIPSEADELTQNIQQLTAQIASLTQVCATLAHSQQEVVDGQRSLAASISMSPRTSEAAPTTKPADGCI